MKEFNNKSLKEINKTIKEKFDFHRLMEYSRVLNQNLRDNFEFEDNLKPLIVSGILLALEDAGFCLAYPTKKKPLEVADLIINTIKERLDRDNIKGVKQSTIVQTYGFMKTNTKIINETDKDGSPNTHLKDLIKEIEGKVKPFLQDYKQYDVIGIFYNEFLRYANGDGGLGIVLTPKHITELFVELAEVNKDKIQEDIKEEEFKFVKASPQEIDGIFRACHNLIWKKETISPTDAFYEFCKLFFIKLKQDKDLHHKYFNQSLDVPLNEFRFSEHWINQQDANNPVNDILFKQQLLPFLKEERERKGKKRIFEDDENINLQSATIKEVVKLLQNVDFYGIDEDLNGRMFETFLSATVRGKDLGQFFTPRNVVKFMVKLADLKVTKDKIETVFDGCSGSGGFLIDAMADIVKKIDAMRSLTNKEKEKIKDKVYSENIYGSEKSLKNSRVTRMNLWFHGDGSSNVYCMDTLDKNFNYDRSLSDERKKEIEEIKKKILDDGLKFDVIFTNPPFSTNYEWNKPDEKEIIEEYDISYKELNKEKDQRVTSLKSNVMFIERYHDLLEKGGKLLTVIDESVLNADQEKYFRKYILSKFILKAVISLPRNTFTNADTGTKTSILYLKKKESEDEEQTPIFMAISENIGHSDSGKPEPEKCDLWKILEEYQKFENGS